MQGHKDLIVWQKAMDLVVAIYKLTKKDSGFGIQDSGGPTWPCEP
ncbi:MAG: four helix bundle protein [Terriglobia bacterium]|jgi:hypothetical protein